MLSSSQTGFIGLRQENINIPFMTQVGTQGESEGCGPPSDPPPTGFFWDSGLGHGWKFDLHSTNTLTCDLFFQGSIDPGTAPGGDFYIGHPPSGGTCANGSSHSIAITPVGDNPTMFIEVPLVD
jgi:hypothetical protein